MEKQTLIVGIFGVLFIFNYQNMKSQNKDSYNSLTDQEEYIIVHKGTEAPFSGKYDKHKEVGTYLCKRCDASLYRSTDKFDSGCGWPSFDDEIEGAIERKPDADGRRTEILCKNCEGHLGHVFLGEQFTTKNTRHCVNSLSLNFEPKIEFATLDNTDTAIFAGGCFWGVEYYFQKVKGVKSTSVGYIGGHSDNPSYEEVCSKKSGHIEAIEVIFDSDSTDFETLAKLFFEIHDPGQLNRQGPDVGEQYKSAIFYKSEEQKETSNKLIEILKENGHEVVTELIAATKFWPAENYHQDYYKRRGSRPYCHFYKKKF